GPAPFRSYHPAYLPQLWRGWLDVGTGGLGDMGCHILDHVVSALELGPPDSVDASHSHYVDRVTWDIPKNNETYPRASMVTYNFTDQKSNRPIKVIWYDGGLKPPRPLELEEGRNMGDQFGGAIYIGTKGKILTGSHGANGVRIIPEKEMLKYEKPVKTIPRSPGHHKEWINACKGGEPAKSNFDYAGHLTETVLLGNIALRTGEKIIWDSNNMRITNNENANNLINREYRKGWEI
ncbi:MAG: hypothetical protein R3250_16745, partial [Melioribacteraceae bacterium]|nr:hypothetical protein [Melioribacteraceae bacterium]